jgi:DNA modification methylase
MPSLHWATKKPIAPISAALKVDSLVYPRGAGYPDIRPQNHLILGDNLAVMSALLPDYEGRIHLIYADPPFFTNRQFPARVGRDEDSRRPQEWLLADGYPDRWPDIDAYLDMLFPRLAMMHRLLSPTGTLYLHLDWHANAYARLLLDEIFGAEHLLNEIIWVYHGPSPIRMAFNRKHDTILAYTKSRKYTFNVDEVRQPYDSTTVKTFESSPKAGFGKVPDLKRGKVPEDWWYFPVIARLHNERTGYPTQKPQGLLERIIRVSSNPGDLVADFFCGSGTTAVAAARLGRKFIANDNTWLAAHTTRRRLVAANTQPFTLQFETSITMERQPKPSTGIKFTQTGLSLDKAFLSNLDYWEVDPAWDGDVFKSIAQAWRPLKRGKIPHELDLFYNTGVMPICVRLVQDDGAQFQINFN